jgi:anti-sigma regulatory factor (Ser/Thr protein kinase)/putative methionine-R-sulfoxide reductase with GAF domain
VSFGVDDRRCPPPEPTTWYGRSVRLNDGQYAMKMALESRLTGARTVDPRTGQIVLPPAPADLVPSDRMRVLYRLSHPALSELGLNELLDELLVRVRQALLVDTVAILLLDKATQQLVARAAKGIEEEVEQGVRIPIGQGFAGRIAAERVAIFIADVDHADILNPILREKGIRSLLGVPLIVEGDLIGVMHVGSLKPRTFGRVDLAVLQVAASRAAPGIERARLFSALEHEHRVAMLLQRSLLPKRLAEVIGVSAAAHYRPASDEVGGDWYDVFELSRSRIGIAIGDVVGHGVRAAALMGQLRTALHAYAMEDHGPARTLELVDRFVEAIPGDPIATAAYAVLDPETGSLRLASAGHPPPIVIGGGSARMIEITPAPPLGAFPYGSCREHEMSLAPGETLLFYTDGLVERPKIPLTHSIGELVKAVRAASSAEEACELAVENLVPLEGLRDDVAIVAMQHTSIPAQLHLRLSAEPHVLADVRRVLRRWLRERGATDRDTAEITLAVNEACTNAIEHAYSPTPAEFELRAESNGDEVTIVVSDFGRWRNPRGSARGRGLSMIEAAVHELEVNPRPDGTEIVIRRSIRA